MSEKITRKYFKKEKFYTQCVKISMQVPCKTDY